MPRAPTEQEEADLIAKLATGELKPRELAPSAEYSSHLETLLTDEITPPPGATIH